MQLIFFFLVVFLLEIKGDNTVSFGNVLVTFTLQGNANQEFSLSGINFFNDYQGSNLGTDVCLSSAQTVLTSGYVEATAQAPATISSVSLAIEVYPQGIQNNVISYLPLTYMGGNAPEMWQNANSFNLPFDFNRDIVNANTTYTFGIFISVNYTKPPSTVTTTTLENNGAPFQATFVYVADCPPLPTTADPVTPISPNFPPAGGLGGDGFVQTASPNGNGNVGLLAIEIAIPALAVIAIVVAIIVLITLRSRRRRNGVSLQDSTPLETPNSTSGRIDTGASPSPSPTASYAPSPTASSPPSPMASYAPSPTSSVPLSNEVIKREPAPPIGLPPPSSHSSRNIPQVPPRLPSNRNSPNYTPAPTDYGRQTTSVLMGFSTNKDDLPVIADYRSSNNPSVGVYGVSIASSQKLGKVPVVIEECVRYLEQYGLKEEGLLRLAGSSSETKTIREAFDKGQTPDFSSVKDVNSVADALKLYLRNLPQKPLLMTKGIKEASGLQDQTRMVSMMTDELTQIPEVNYYALKRIFGLMRAVANNAKVTLMSPDNIAIVFHPTLQIPQSIITLLITQPQVWVK